MQVLIVVLSLIGITAAVYLVQQKTHFLSQAYSGDQMLQMFSNVTNPSLANSQTKTFNFSSTSPNNVINATSQSIPSSSQNPGSSIVLGNNNSPSTSESYNQNMINGSRFTTNSGQSYAQSISVYLANYDGASPQIQMAIYTDINGSPGRLIWNSSDIIGNHKGWISVSLPSIPLYPNTAYWLMFNTHGKAAIAEVNPGQGISWNSNSVKYGDWPPVLSSGTLSHKEYFIYLSLSPSPNLITPTTNPSATLIPTYSATPITSPTSIPTPAPTTPIYPTISNLILGFKGTPAVTDTGDLNSLDGGEFTTGSQGGPATSMSIYINQVDSTNPGVQLGIYTDYYGKPQNLLWHSSTFNAIQGWNTVPISQSVNLSANTSYWLLFNVNGAGTEGGWDANSGNGWYSGNSNVSFGTWSNSISYSGNTDSQLYAIYVTYSSTNTSPSPTISSNSSQSSFVSNCNGQFCINGVNKKFVGVNFYGLLGNCGPSANSNYDSVMQTLSQAGVTLVRFWLFQPMGRSVSDLQNALDAAQNHGIYLLPVFANQWADCDGSQKDDSWYGGGYTANYKPYVLNIVQQFKNNPAVFGWMLMNEAEDGTNPNNLYNFTQDMADSIRQVDQNHLVTLGTIGRGQGGTLVSTGDYANLYNIPNIGFVEAHDYDSFDIAYPDVPSGDGIASDVQVAHDIGKPMLIGEEGMSSTNAKCNNGNQAWSNRPAYTQNKISQAFQHGVSAYILWMFDLNGGGDGCEFSPGDPLMNVLKTCSIGSC